ncbi:MAG: response regulator [Syntrophobacterales bacterium]
MAQEHILVVEDEEDIRELLRYNLAKEGYRVTGVTSGEEALRTAKTLLPDLVLLDLMLPGVDGLQICRVLKHDTRTQHVPVVMVTAKGEEADIVIGLELGADDYITKPFSPRVLLARLRSVLRRRTRTVSTNWPAGPNFLRKPTT